MASSSSRTVLWMAAALVAVAVAGAWWLSRSGSAPASVQPVPVAAPTPVVAPAPAPPAPSAPPTGHVYVEGKGEATVVASEVNPSIPPPDAAQDDPSVNPPIQPEKPQTPEWKLEKTTRLVQLMDQRHVRLEKRIQEAEVRGDKAAAEDLRILLERSRKRKVELEQDMEALRAEIRSSGSTPPAVAGGAKP